MKTTDLYRLVPVVGALLAATVAYPKENQSPVFPEKMEVVTSTQNEYDEVGRLRGGTTTIEVKTPAVDPDGDTITYEWSGTDVDHTQFSSGDPKKVEFKSNLKGEGLKAVWTRVIIMGELASGILYLKARDGKGGEAVHRIAIGRRVR